MTMGTTKLARVEEILRNIPGVVQVARLDADRWRAIDLESAYEVSSVLPVRNLGVKLLASRDHCYAILKDGRFRAPKSPTVYLVEQDLRGDAAHPSRWRARATPWWEKRWWTATPITPSR